MHEKKGLKADQSPGAAMTTPAVDVELFSSKHAVTAVFSQPADGAVCGDAAIDDC